MDLARATGEHVSLVVESAGQLLIPASIVAAARHAAGRIASQLCTAR